MPSQGLIIIRATYGSSKIGFHEQDTGHHTDSWKDGNGWTDVTIPLQSLVQDSKLSIPSGPSKASVLVNVSILL